MRKLTLRDRIRLFKHPLKAHWINEFGDVMTECTKELEYIEPDYILITAEECVDHCALIGGLIGLAVGVAGTAIVFLIRKRSKKTEDDAE